MNKWKKVPQGLKDLFDELMPAQGVVERRQMFGCPCAFIHGNMCCGLHQDNLLMRLDAAGREEFLAMEGAEVFEPMPGRPMKEYVVAPPELLEDQHQLQQWLRRSVDFVGSLPPKVKKATPRAAKKKAARKRG